MKNWEKIMRTLRSQVAGITAVGMLASGIVVLSGTPANAAAGDPDTTFSQNVSAVNQNNDQMITSAAVQPDGKVIAVGRIETGPGNGISRYNADGTADVAFNNQTRQLGVNATTWTVAVQADGKILAGGQFGVPAPGLLRLNADGTLDQPFSDNTRFLLDGGVWHLIPLPSGKILIGGAFENLNGALGSKYFARLNSDGTPDVAFNANVNASLNLDDWVQEMAPQEDGSILLGGFFQDPGTSSYLARVNPDGTRDINFSLRVQQSINNDVESVTLQSNGQILVGGHFSTPSPILARYNSDGTPDASFNNAVSAHLIANEEAYSVRALPNRILIGGDFRLGEAPTPYLTAFTYDGEPANAYNDRISRDRFNDRVQWITEQPYGAVIVGGEFTNPARYLAGFRGDPPTSTAAPTLSQVDGVTVGTPISGTAGAWNDPSVTYEYQWQVCSSNNVSTCTDIPGATAALYTPSTADNGKYVRMATYATSANGRSEPAYSGLVAVGAPAVPPAATPGTTPGAAVKATGTTAVIGNAQRMELDIPRKTKRRKKKLYEVFFTASDVPGTVTFTFKRKKRVRTVTVPIEDGIAEYRWKTPRKWPRGKTRVTATYVPSAGSPYTAAVQEKTKLFTPFLFAFSRSLILFDVLL